MKERTEVSLEDPTGKDDAFFEKIIHQIEEHVKNL